MKHIGTLVILLATSTYAFAGVSTPEIDGNTAGAAIALVSGGLMVLRGRRKR
ncbi:MAG: hypothetical protein ABIR70_09615 [Bryobacteraceae bacterium]